MWSCLRVPVLETKYKGSVQEECAPLLDKIRRVRAVSHESLCELVLDELRRQKVSGTVQMYETPPPDCIQSIVYCHLGQYIQVFVACDEDRTIYELAQEGRSWVYIIPPSK